MPRIMYDSVNPFAIPEHAQMVLVYVDGIYKWSQAGRDRFKYAQQVTCSAIGAVPAHVGDVEAGCIWPPADAVPWVQMARTAGFDPTVYVNELNDWEPVRQAFRRAGVPEPHYLVANYNGIPAVPPGSVGRQYAHPSSPPGNPAGPWHTAGHWDESWIADYWPGVDEHPAGGGAGNDEGDDEMVAVHAVLPASVAPKMVQIQLPVVGMSEELPDGPKTWAQVAISVPFENARIWALWALTTPGVSKGKGQEILLAGPGRAPSSETGEPPVNTEKATLGYDLYVPYALPRGTFAVTVYYSSNQDLSVLITGGKDRKMPALGGAQ